MSSIINKYTKKNAAVRFNGAVFGLLAFGLTAVLMAMSVCTAQANTITWLGSAGSDWNTATNWSPAAVPGSSDDVQIGLATFNSSAQPVISNAVQCNSITFGTLQAIVLTVNSGSSLTVAGSIALLHSENNLVPLATITGAGMLTCGSLLVGNGDYSNVVITKTTEMILSVATVMVTGSVYINSVSADLLSGGLAHNDALLSLQGGVLTVSGQVRLTNVLPYYLTGTMGNLVPYARLRIDVNTGQNPRLVVLGSPGITIADVAWGRADFYNDLPGFSGTGSANVTYAGGRQLVLSNQNSGVDVAPADYQNLVISGNGRKNTENNSGDTLTVGGNLSVLLDSLDMQINNAVLIVSGHFRNTGMTKLGNSAFFGSSFSNDATLVTNADTLQFPGNNQALTDSTAGGTTLTNATFTIGLKTIATGQYIIPAAGTWRVTNDSTAMDIAPGATLVFRAGGTPATLRFTSAAPPTGLIGVNNRRSLNGIAPSVKSPGAAAISVSNIKRAATVPLSPVNPPAGIASQAAALIILKLTGNKGAEETTILFSQDAHARYMPSEDKYALPKRKSAVSIFSYSADRVPLAVNKLPLAGAGETIEISISAEVSGAYVINFPSTGNLPQGYKVVLFDKKNRAVADLRLQSNYTFNIDKKDSVSFGNRFQLILTKI